MDVEYQVKFRFKCNKVKAEPGAILTDEELEKIGQLQLKLLLDGKMVEALGGEIQKKNPVDAPSDPGVVDTDSGLVDSAVDALIEAVPAVQPSSEIDPYSA